MKTIKVSTSLSNLQKGGKACYQLSIKNPVTLSEADFAKLFATALGRTEAEARYLLDVHGKVLAEQIIANKLVNTGSIRANLVVKGSVASAGAKLDPINNPVGIAIYPWGDLKSAAAEIVAENDTQVIEAALYTVQYADSTSLNTIEGTGTIKINGKGLLFNASATDEGVWLEKLDGTVVTSKATVTANTTNTIDCAFATLPSVTEGDQFKLVVSTRDGNSTATYGTTRLERQVRVIVD